MPLTTQFQRTSDSARLMWSAVACRRFPKPWLAGAALCVTIAGVSCVGALATASGKAQSPAHSAKKALTAPSEARMPFRTGEKLDYRVAWASFANAASIELTVPERRDLMGWGTWHFRASAHTLSPMRALIMVDDQFDSYTDAATLESRQYETYLNEMGEKQTEVFHFVAEGQPSRGHVAGVVVTPGTRDPLGAAYALRGVDWAQTPEFRAPVYDGHDVYDMRARLDVPAETVAVAAGNFSVSKISIRLFQRGTEVSGESFTAWLANDAARTPVLLVAEMPFGNLRVELVSEVQ
ncbi:MAG: DUF3108 domain-containing protein [Candidatus Acidiferrales bacterium]